MNENSVNENEIRDVLGEGIGAEPPIVGGPAAVFAGARARVVRTRAVTGALSVVAVLGVAAGAVALGGGSGRSGPAVAAGASTTTVPTTTAPTTKAAKTTAPSSAVTSSSAKSMSVAPQPGPGQVLIDGRSAVEIVKSRLAPGLVSANYSGQDSYQPARSGVMVNGLMSVDDGTGKLTTVSAGIQQNSGMAQVTDCMTMQKLMSSGISDCRASAEPDGSVVLSFVEDEYAAGANGPTAGSYLYQAIRVLPNGWVVDAEAANYFDPLNDPHETGWHVDPSRKDPLLSRDQVVAIVMDSEWGATVSSDFAQHARQDLVPYKDLTQH
ncbi:hypothetical protein [Catenulispora rubra]|uniref:hypothetical protein n=1 Tax=Catenulispora rubra TaxID=280293 RepID=UPI0018922B51|nr:hypothetical protein [Catenulispora rubra]